MTKGLTEKEEAEFDRYFPSHIFYDSEKPIWIKKFINTLLAKREREVREKFKKGEICSSCGLEMEGELSDWCIDCLENN